MARDLLPPGAAVPHQPPPQSRPIRLPRWSVVHGGCRWVEAEPFARPAISTCYGLWWADQPGTLEVAADGRRSQRWPITPDLLVFVPPGLPLRRSIPRRAIHFYLSLRLDPPCQIDRPHLHPIGPAEADLLRRVIPAQIARGEPQPVEAVATAALVALVLAALPEDAWREEVEDARIRVALARLRRDPAAPLRIAELAAEAGLSTGRFLRLFRAQTGNTPQRLRRDWRLDLAADALRAGVGIKAAARAAGWAERTRFSTAFRARFGLPPARWLRHQER